MAHPDRVTAIVSQNGTAYEVGLGESWAPIRKYWAKPTPENRPVEIAAAMKELVAANGVLRGTGNGVSQ